MPRKSDKQKVLDKWQDIEDILRDIVDNDKEGNFVIYRNACKLSIDSVTEFEWGTNVCVFCEKYHENECKRCPIKVATGKGRCLGTPWYKFHESMDIPWYKSPPVMGSEDFKRALKHAEAMNKLLRRILK